MKKAFLFPLMGILFATLSMFSHGAEVSMPVADGKTPSIPVDVLQFESEFNAAMLGGDADRATGFFSQRYLHDGRNKKAQDQAVAMLVMNASSYKLRLTSFKAISKNRAYITAEVTSSFGNYDKKPDYQIIRENGQWRWLGNQKKSP